MKFVLIAMLSAMRWNTAPQLATAQFDDLEACQRAGAALEQMAEKTAAASIKAQWTCVPAASEKK